MRAGVTQDRASAESTGMARAGAEFTTCEREREKCCGECHEHPPIETTVIVRATRTIFDTRRIRFSCSRFCINTESVNRRSPDAQ